MSNEKQTYMREIDHLALGLTRSPMFMGVNIKTFFANLILCTLIAINIKAMLGIILYIVLHLMMAKISVKEPDFLSIYIKSFFKTPPVLNKWYWGKTNSYEPW